VTAQTSLGLRSEQVENHPLVDDVNALHNDALSPIERTCRKIADATGAPIALILAILLQFIWIIGGLITRFDPFPFVFLLTCSNVLQLILIFVIAVAQRQQSQHDEIRAEADHDVRFRESEHSRRQPRVHRDRRRRCPMEREARTRSKGRSGHVASAVGHRLSPAARLLSAPVDDEWRAGAKQPTGGAFSAEAGPAQERR